MLSIPVLAAGVVGTCFGGVVVALWFRGRPPMVPMADVQSLLSMAADEVRFSHQLVREAHDAMGILAQRLSDKALALFRTEQELADVHIKLARMNAAEQERADAEEMGLGEAA